MSDEDTLFNMQEFFSDAEPKEKNVSMADVRQVFDYWVATMRNSGRGVKPRLDNKRKNCIAKAIAAYDVDTCMDAIRGCKLSDFHMGSNPRGKVYDDITLILRNADKIEKFANLAADGEDGWEHEQD